MKLIIAGGRNITAGIAMATMDIHITDIQGLEIVSGGARGVDTWGENWAKVFDVPVKRFPADWSKGRGAGHIRNAEMAKYADELLLIWDGSSKGSANMKKQMERLGKPVTEIIVEY